MWDTLLSPTYHTRVHCLPLTILLATHIFYGLSLKPFSINMSEYNLYHCRAYYMHPYMERNTNTYKTFCPFSYLTFLLCSGLIWYIISMNVPLHFYKKLSFGISRFKYPPVMSKVATSIPTYVLITSVVNEPSRNTVVDATLSSSLKYLFSCSHLRNFFS